MVSPIYNYSLKNVQTDLSVGITIPLNKDKTINKGTIKYVFFVVVKRLKIHLFRALLVIIMLIYLKKELKNVKKLKEKMIIVKIYIGDI